MKKIHSTVLQKYYELKKNTIYKMSLHILQEFRSNLVKFFDELIEQFPNEPDLVIIRILVKDRVPIDSIMEYFMNEIVPQKERIQSRDDTFFSDGKSLFGMLPEQQRDTFKRIWKSPKLDKEDRMAIWKWTDLFVVLSEKYKKSLYKF